jgi:predicted RNase H-like HicB family nuclease
MSNKLVYPVILRPAKEGGYDVYLPDFDKNTQGDDLGEALYMAQDAIEMMGVYWQDEGKDIPAPSDISAVRIKNGEIKTLVPADFDAYRRKTETRVIKKTLSLPSWLNVEAEAAGINFSATLQEALKDRLAVK